MSKKGNLSINSENMFPIIKKWLYSDHDIFYRELISNACDAITKLKKMDVMGDYALPEGYVPRVDILVNPEERTIKVIDNGLGMTEDEVEEYINQVAFSGANDFLEKYKDKGADDQIISHFGLGFYSAFMVAEEVEIHTLSYKEGATGVHWTCDGSSEFTMEECDKKDVGTVITLHLSEDTVEFCNIYRAKEVVQKYCSFMPYEIFLAKENETETVTIDKDEMKEDDVFIEDVPVEKKEDDKDIPKPRVKVRKRPELLNDTHPLWTKNPSECEKDDYLAFYRKVFQDYKEPLFWIHLNMDYPFNLKGILYFPKINIEYETVEGTIKLYNSQVFIADNIKEVIPEFLMLLKGVIDCPDLPLNVSRSALQNDGFVTKISDYISKKVAEKLAGLCKTDRENYDKYWDDIAPFIKYGCLKDEKFCEKMNDYILFKNLDGKYITLPDALQINKAAEEAAAAQEDEETPHPSAAQTPSPQGEGLEHVEGEVVDSAGTTPEDLPLEGKVAPEGSDEVEKEPRIIYYVTDEQQQGQYIKMFKAQKMEAFIMDKNIDAPFMQQLEMKNEGVKFQRIDADLTDTFKSKTSKKVEKEFEEAQEKVAKMMQKALKIDKLNVQIGTLKDKKIASMLTVSEESRRMADMMKMYAMDGMGMGDFTKEGQTLVLNASHPLVKYVMEHEDDANSKLIGKQLYDLAKLQNAPLSPEEMAAFVERSNEIMMTLTK
ncbi:MAG: molecular chaperone HtpG [Lachnospiraceae bacterium]|nr:molecular chaperone HtpG [Lachnospiraceae bacterium]